MIDLHRIEQFAKNKKPIQNLIGRILQQGEIYVSDDHTLSWKIRVLKGEIILIEKDTLAEDPMEIEETFADLYAFDLLYDKVKANHFSIPFDKEQLLDADKQTLAEVKDIMEKILPRIQEQQVVPDER